MGISRKYFVVALASLPIACGAPDDPAFDFIAALDQAYVFEATSLIDLGTFEARTHLAEGWNDGDSRTEGGPTWVWGTGGGSTLTFVVREPGPTALGLRGRAFDYRPRLPLPDVVVQVNGETIGELAMSPEWADYRLEVPPGVLKSGKNTLHLDYRYVSLEGRELEAEVPAAGSGVWVAAWETIDLGLAESALPAPPRAAGDWLGMPVGSRVQYWVAVTPGAAVHIDSVEFEGDEGPRTRDLTLSVHLEAPADTVTVRLDDPDLDWPLRVALPVTEPQFAVVELENAGQPDGGSSGGPQAVAWLRRPRVVESLALASAGDDLTCEACNVVLVSIDTLRSDRLGVYGYGRGITPHIDAFRSDAVLFENHIVHAPSTLSSHSSLFTGLLPPHHTASIGKRQPLPAGLPTLAQLLGSRGFATAAFTDGGQLDSVWGVDAGFGEYEIAPTGRNAAGFAETVRRAEEWIDRSDRPFFLFLHTYQVHKPYTPKPEDLARVMATPGGYPDIAEMEQLVAAYDAEVLDMDRSFGALVEMLKERDLYQSSIVIFTSDHGEEFGDHGKTQHSHTLFDELLRVPMLVKLGDSLRGGETFAGVSRSVDVLPTILELVGAGEPPEAIDGVSLFGPRRPVDSIAFSELDAAGPAAAMGSVRTLRWKLMAKSERLHDLAADPGERGNFSNRYPVAVMGLRRHLFEMLVGPAAEPGSVELSEEMLERLRALGYIR